KPALTIHLESHLDARLASAAWLHAIDHPPTFAAQLAGRPARAAHHMDRNPLFVIARGREALRRAGWNLASLRDELCRGAAGLLDRDRFSQSGWPRVALAAREGERDRERHDAPHRRSASSSASARMRRASS